MLDACHSFDLSARNQSHRRKRAFIVGCKLGLTSRFSQHVCDAVTKALSTTRLPHLKFVDVQAIRPQYTSRKVPDVAMLAMSADASLKPIIVGELKTFWTFRLRTFRLMREFRSLTCWSPIWVSFKTSLQTLHLTHTRPACILHANARIGIWLPHDVSQLCILLTSCRLSLRTVFAHWPSFYRPICPPVLY